MQHIACYNNITPRKGVETKMKNYVGYLGM